MGIVISKIIMNKKKHLLMSLVTRLVLLVIFFWQVENICNTVTDIKISVYSFLKTKGHNYAKELNDFANEQIAIDHAFDTQLIAHAGDRWTDIYEFCSGN